MSIKGLQKIRNLYFNEGNEGGRFAKHNQKILVNYFMKTTIDTLKTQSDTIADIQKWIAENSIDYNKHQALLNNCVDDDEAILHKREIEGEVKDNENNHKRSAIK